MNVIDMRELLKDEDAVIDSFLSRATVDQLIMYKEWTQSNLNKIINELKAREHKNRLK